jgi:hypothetical protein
MFNFFKKGNKETAEELLVNKIFGYSLESVSAINSSPNLVNPQELTEQKIILALYHFNFFFLHICSRYIFQKFGSERKIQVIDSLVSKIEIKYMEEIFKDYNMNDREILHSLFSAVYEIAENSYGKCNSLRDEKSSVAARLLGATSNSLVTCFTDHLSRVYFDEDVSSNILFNMSINKLIADILATRDFEAIIDDM